MTTPKGTGPASIGEPGALAPVDFTAWRRREIADRQLSLSAVAELTDTNPNTVCGTVRIGKTPRWETYQRLVRLVGLSPAGRVAAA